MRDVAVIIHYNSCNAGEDSSTINARKGLKLDTEIMEGGVASIGV